jgi:hypothetical protein
MQLLPGHKDSKDHKEFILSDLILVRLRVLVP